MWCCRTISSWKNIYHVWPVLTTEAHLAYAGARTHSNNTAEISSMIEALSFLGNSGTLARDARSCFFYGSKRAAGVCFGHNPCSDVQLGLSYQRLLLKVQLRLRFTMQHVYSHAETLGNECADRAAALRIFGLVSNQNLSTRWARHSLIPIHALLLATTLVMSWNSYVILEQRRYLPPTSNQKLACCLTPCFFVVCLPCVIVFPGRFSLVHLAQSFLVAPFLG